MIKMMRVYMFASHDGGSAVLKDRRLRISRLDRLNDQFEFLGADLSRREHRRALRNTKRQLAKTRGLLCFSKSWHNPVLWGHYAERHKGVCLGFDLPSNLLTQVRYVTSRFPWPDAPSYEFMQQILLAKFVHWSYEDEYRAWVSLEEADGEHYYYPFSETLQLKRVLVGSESTFTRREITEALGDLQKTVETFKVRPAFRSFRVVRNQNESLWR
jgi:hypothetical protein